MVELASIPKNSREEIRISLDEFKGHQLVNLRVFFKADDGEMRPSKKGLAFKASLLPDMLDALRKASELEVQP